MDLSLEINDHMKRRTLKQLKLMARGLDLDESGTKHDLATRVVKQQDADRARAWDAIARRKRE